MNPFKHFSPIYTGFALVYFISSANSALYLGNYRTLAAATRDVKLSQRDHGIRLSHEAELIYIDEARVTNQETVVFSKINVGSSNPFLLLEDIEHHLNRVYCTESTIELGFDRRESFENAKKILADLQGNHIITSHKGCNIDGGRAPFLVESTLVSEETRTLKMTTQPRNWDDAFQSLKVEYGHTKDTHRVRCHKNLYRRDSEISSSSSPTSFFTATSIIPTSSPTATSAVLDLRYEMAEKKFESPLKIGPPLPISIGCKLCKTAGTLKMTQAGINIINLDDIHLAGGNATSPLNYINGGQVHLEMNGFNAHIELQVEPRLKGSLTYQLFNIPVVGFTIPHFGKAGITFTPEIDFEWELSGGIALSYGFELAVPDGSQITVNLTNPNRSSVSGFEKTKIKAVPFQANTSDIELSMELVLRPRIDIGFSFLDNRFLAEVGPYIDLPRFSLDITQLASANASVDCETTSTTPVNQMEFKKAFKNFTHIVSDITMGAALDLHLRADAPLVNPKFETKVTMLSTQLPPLPTACLAYQASGTAGSMLMPAASAFAQFEAKMSKKGSGAESLDIRSRSFKFGESGGVWMVFIGVLSYIMFVN